MDQRPTTRYLVFGVGETHLPQLAYLAKREPTWEENRRFALAYHKPIVMTRPLWVLEMDVTPQGMVQLWNAEPALLTYVVMETSDEDRDADAEVCDRVA